MPQLNLDPFREPETIRCQLPAGSIPWVVTGHRFNRILQHTLADNTIATVPVADKQHRSFAPNDYKLRAKNRLQRYVQLTLAEINPRPTVMYIGMAEGFDTEVAIACSVMKIPFIACLPFRGHAAEYSELIKHSVELVYTSDGCYKANWQYIKRDKYMIDRGERVLAFWNGDEQSGTGITVRYAERRFASHPSKPIENCWQPWSSVVYKDKRDCPYPMQSSLYKRMSPYTMSRMERDLVASDPSLTFQNEYMNEPPAKQQQASP